jgi:hypothetical protein
MIETGPKVITRNAFLGALPAFRPETSFSIEDRSEQNRDAFRKTNTPVDLRQPFDEVVSSVLSLPWGHAGSENRITEAELRTFLREVCEAANGRQVETVIGFIPIAPPVAEFLKAKPYQATTRIGLLMEVAMRILCGPNDSTDEEANSSINHEY